ncbi:MAG: hypothetical protein AMK72_10595 [Planctomycetes bacterium SM23_25]|nr:MAG: hypothetical protein AMK72_10595 [Planctomycetes bacterium SM23_25]
MTTRRARLTLPTVLVVLAAAPLVAGCGAWHDERQATFGFNFPPPAPDEGPSAIVFFVDGVNRDVFDRMLADGRLPMIRKYFVERGLYCERCVANVPSVTLANETSFVTGQFVGRHGITGINWFDRNRVFWRDYEEVNQKNTLDGDYTAPTIFERLSDATTMSLFFQAHRGATKFVENWTSAGPPYFFGWYDFVDRLSLWRFDIVAHVAKAREAFPKFIIAYMLMPDMVAYRSGVSSPDYEQALEHTDAHIGRVLRDLEAAGRLENTAIVLVSDHGMTDIVHHWPIEKFLRDEVRLSMPEHAFADDIRFEFRLHYYRRFACVLAGSGDRYWALYLRKPRAGVGESGKPDFENWLVRPSADDLRAYPTRDGRRVDLIRALRDAEAVDVVAYRPAADRVHLVTKKGIVELARPSPESRDVSLRTLRGDDPLGYSAHVPPEMLLGKPHSPEAWLQASADTPYPDLVPQIMAYFDAPRAGDIAVFAAPGWDFSKKHKAGHGGVRPAEMFTVLLMAGPGVPHERRAAPVRAVDVVPTLLELLGRPVPTDIDGRSILRK